MQLTSSIHVLAVDFSVPLPSGTVKRSARVTMICLDRITLIDSGVMGSEQAIFDYLLSIGRRPEEIATMILTHSHPDHLGAARAIVDKTGCRVVAHEGERAWIEDVELQSRQRQVPGFHSLVGGSVAVDQCVSHGDTLDSGEGVPLVVLHTPGHSAGSISLWEPEQGLLISGDAVPVAGEMPVFDDYTASLASLKLLAELPAKWLVSAWEAPLHGDEIKRRITASCEWLHQIHETVRGLAGERTEHAPLELCERFVAATGLPKFAVNPLVAQSLIACLASNK